MTDSVVFHVYDSGSVYAGIKYLGVVTSKTEFIALVAHYYGEPHEAAECPLCRKEVPA